MRLDDLEQLTNFHKDLNPDLWNDQRELRPEVRLALFKIARAFVEFINVDDLRLTDITLSGSNASYNYNDNSDIDLHLIADVNSPCAADLQELFLAKKSLFNDQHDISILGHDVEVYVQMNDQTHISNGVYSIYDNRWLKKPGHIQVQPDVTNIEHKYKQLDNDIQQAIDSGDAATMHKLKSKIKKMRQAGLEKNGEYGVENLTFKLLRNTGAMDRLFDASVDATDKQLSLRQLATEGNAFTGALTKAREAGLKEFTVDGKTFQVRKGRKISKPRKQNV
jgi:hypothetical protein